MPERKEALMRIVVAIVSGIILGLWKTLILILAVFHWIYIIFADKRNKRIAEFSNVWATQAYRFIRYMTFTTNSRPFPFSDLGDVLNPIEMRNKK